MARAIRRAFQAGRSPPITLAHSRGSRCRSSSASPKYARPVSVGIPTAAANSGMQNSATNGAPSPAIGSARSPKSPAQAASAMESTQCIAAHATASWSCRAAIGVRDDLEARAAASTSAAVSRSKVVVPAMGPTQAAGTDTQTPKTRVLHNPGGHGRVTKITARNGDHRSTPTAPPAAHGR